MSRKTTEVDIAAVRKADWPIDPALVARWSPRSMSGESITDRELMTLFEAARWAPSSYNSQPWRFVYARRDTSHWARLFELLGRGNQAWCKNAAVLIVIVARNFLDPIKQPAVAHKFDAGAAWMSLALQGSKLGLVVHGMQGFDYEKARAALNVPADCDVCAMVAIGRPGTLEQLDPSLHEREKPNTRKAVAEFIFEGGFAK